MFLRNVDHADNFHAVPSPNNRMNIKISSPSRPKINNKMQCVRKDAVQLGYGTYIWLSVSNVPLNCAVLSLYSVVKQRLKRSTGKVCNCLIQFLLTVVLSIEERFFIRAQRLSERTVFCTLNNSRLSCIPVDGGSHSSLPAAFGRKTADRLIPPYVL
jgi:hypothetical protein